MKKISMMIMEAMEKKISEERKMKERPPIERDKEKKKKVMWKIMKEMKMQLMIIWLNIRS